MIERWINQLKCQVVHISKLCSRFTTQNLLNIAKNMICAFRINFAGFKMVLYLWMFHQLFNNYQVVEQLDGPSHPFIRCGFYRQQQILTIFSLISYCNLQCLLANWSVQNPCFIRSPISGKYFLKYTDPIHFEKPLV